MFRDLKKLVSELEKVLLDRGGLLDAPVREDLKVRIEDLKREINSASATDKARLCAEALRIMAALLTIVTNVMMLLK